MSAINSRKRLLSLHNARIGLLYIFFVGCFTSIATDALSQDLPQVFKTPSATDSNPTTVWQKISERSYESESPGLGSSKGYQSRWGIITIYDYTYGIQNWREGVDDTRFFNHMKEVLIGIQEAERKGIYTNARFLPIEKVSVSRHHFLYLHGTLETNGKSAWSGTLLTVHRGRILKLRMSSEILDTQVCRTALFDFVQAYLALKK